jgi:uncharacterized protein DUF1570
MHKILAAWLALSGLAHAHTALELERHAAELRKHAPPGFSVAVAAPFVVAGDGGEEAVARWASRTVGWAVARLKEAYFPRDPDVIIDVWLFRDSKSYRRWTKELFGDEPDTPYGYYSAQHHALIMNIGTGGGTLVHELVHPFVEANFPSAPPWLNEGLGSLYEQSDERDGRIVGLTNWRLRGLKRAIQAKRLPPFKTMLAADADAFYGSETSYGQARYLLYYLQEKGLLGEFYKRFRAAAEVDPTGAATLEALLGDLAAFQPRWETWVLGLTFDG